MRLAAILLCLLFATSAEARGEPRPREPNTALVLAGGLVAGTVFLAGIPITQVIGKDSEATALMMIPLAGPFIVGAIKPVSNAQGVALAAAAVAQSVGLTLVIVGLLTDHAVEP